MVDERIPQSFDDSLSLNLSMDLISANIHNLAVELEYCEGEPRMLGDGKPKLEDRSRAEENLDSNSKEDASVGVEPQPPPEYPVEEEKKELSSLSNNSGRSSGGFSSQCFLPGPLGSYWQYTIAMAQHQKTIRITRFFFAFFYSTFAYPLDTVQSQVAWQADSQEPPRTQPTLASNYLLLHLRSGMQRVYFTGSTGTAYLWHKEILRQQGFLSSRISQYRRLELLCIGGYSRVHLCEHVNSKR